MVINRCVCFNVTFEQLKAVAQERQCGMNELRETFGCGKGCSLCVPYIEAMLRTGQAHFDPAVPPPA